MDNILLSADFQVIADNNGFAPAIPECKRISQWNAYACHNDNLGQLIFESLDADKMSRSSQPVYMIKEGTRMMNKLNAFMDHCWDGFYTCQERLQRFVSVVEGTKGSVYNITYTGSPP
jgi:hypothetical protein